MQISSASMFATASAAGKSSASSAANVNWADAPADETSMSGARAEFSKYMQMTPAEKMHAAMLAQMGVTEDEYKAMSSDDRTALDQQIKEKIKAQAQAAADGSGKKGLLADVTV